MLEVGKFVKERNRGKYDIPLAVDVSGCEGFEERREALQQLFGSFAFEFHPS
jgi:hypothetical protein